MSVPLIQFSFRQIPCDHVLWNRCYDVAIDSVKFDHSRAALNVSINNQHITNSYHSHVIRRTSYANLRLPRFNAEVAR
jgi:hypothetical protein